MKTYTKLTSSVLAATMLAAASLTAVSAVEDNTPGTVRVIVRNDVYSAQNGADWDGVLIDEIVSLDDNDSVTSVMKGVFESYEMDYTFSDSYKYFQSVNGLDEYENNGSGGWMITLNDWFTAQGTDAYTVQNGKLKDGDELCMQYSCSWGADISSMWSDSTTTLSSLEVTGAQLESEFSADNKEYTLRIDSNTAEILLTPTAYNKNFQVRIYKNEYTPESSGSELVKSRSFEVENGDTVYIGVANPNWETMNSMPYEETVYKLSVSSEVSVQYDVNGDGAFDINDATAIQLYLADLDTLSENGLKAADANGDGSVDINDATHIQLMLAELV